MPRFSRSFRDLAISLMLALAVTLIYAQTVRHHFVNLDDNEYVYENSNIAGGLTASTIIWSFTAFHSANWHPITWLSHATDIQLYNLWAPGHHITSIVLQVLVTILLYFLLKRFLGQPWPAALAAAIFALHPLRVESVAWVSERKDLLSALFFILTLFAWLRYLDRPAIARYLVVTITYAMGLLCKPMLVSLPFVFLLLDYWPLKRMGRLSEESTGSRAQDKSRNSRSLCPFRVSNKFLLLEKLPLLGLAAGSSLITLFAQQTAMERVPFFFRVTNAIVTTAAYLGQTLLPLRLAPFYPLATKGPPPAQIAVASVILISISALTIVYRRRYPFLLVGWLWYLVMLLPVIGLIQVGDQSGADRYTYLPLIGPTVAVIAWATSVLRQQRSENNGLLNANRPRRRIVISAWVGPMSALTLGLLASWAWWQASFWSDPIRLWVHALQARGENYFVMHDYASALIGVGRGADAKRYLQREIQLKCSAEALADLGGISIDDGNLEEGIAQLRESLRGIPSNARVHSHLADALEKTHKSDEAIAEYRKALDLEPQLYEAKFGLGTALAHQNRFAEALPYFQSLVTHDQTAKIPVERDRKTEDLLGLGNTLLRLGRGPEAVEAFSRAVDLNPRLVEAQYNLGLLFMATNRRSEAAEHLEKAIAADPSYVPAQNGLAAVLASEGKYSAAVVHFRKAVELDPKNVLARANLGRTLSRLGQHAAAIEELKAALQLEPYQPQAAAWLAWSLATAPDEKLRNGKEALLWGEKAVAAIGTRDPAALDALAAAQAELGQFAAAVRSCQQAQQLAKSYGNQSLAAEIEERIELYRVNKPYRSR